MSVEIQQQPKTVGELRESAWRSGYLEWKLWDQQIKIYDIIRRLPPSSQTIAILCARQYGKTLSYQTLISTPTGPIAIKDILIGQDVYGYNADGSVSVCKVVDKVYKGIEKVVKLTSRDREIVTCTKEHKFLSTWKDSKKSAKKQQVLTTEEILTKRSRKISRTLIDAPLGSVVCKDAYVIGALIGNGCNRQGVNQLHISSPDDRVPKRVAEIIGCDNVYEQHHTNFTYVLSSEAKYSRKKLIPYEVEHQEWFKDKYSHEKYIDQEIISTWNRESCLKLLAGLTDTDGHVSISADGTLSWRYATGSKQLADDVQWLVYRLFQHKPGVTKHTRKGSDEYTIHVISNLHATRILKQISEFMVMDHKKYLPEYDELNFYNSKENFIGVKATEEHEAPCYDIQIDNDTNLYVLHNEGLITHNSFLGTLLAVEDCIRNPGYTVCIVGPTIKQTVDIVHQSMRLIITDAPLGMVVRSKSESRWRIGQSELLVGGFDTVNATRMRGKRALKIYIEEVVDSNPDDYLEALRSDLGPMLTHSPTPQMIFLTTPPRIPGHPFNTHTTPEAELNGAFFKFTIKDNKQLTPEQYQACIRRAGGEHTTEFKREYMCEVVRDTSVIVVPDFDIQRHVGACDMPDASKTQITIDWGGVRDMTVALIHCHQFMTDTDLILDEMAWPANTATEHIVMDLKKLEKTWGQYGIHGRYGDVPGQLMVDLKQSHDYELIMPPKDDWQSAINQVNVMFAQNKVIVNPRCKFLIASLQSGAFNKHKTDFERTAALGHCDALAALMYALRVQNRENPWRQIMASHDTAFIYPKKDENMLLSEAIAPRIFENNFNGGFSSKRFGKFRG